METPSSMCFPTQSERIEKVFHFSRRKALEKAKRKTRRTLAERLLIIDLKSTEMYCIIKTSLATGWQNCGLMKVRMTTTLIIRTKSGLWCDAWSSKFTCDSIPCLFIIVQWFSLLNIWPRVHRHMNWYLCGAESNEDFPFNQFNSPLRRIEIIISSTFNNECLLAYDWILINSKCDLAPTSSPAPTNSLSIIDRFNSLSGFVIDRNFGWLFCILFCVAAKATERQFTSLSASTIQHFVHVHISKTINFPFKK